MRVNSKRRSSGRGTHAEQLRLPLGEDDIRQNNKVRGVYRDPHAHHAIVYRIGKIKISFVEMKKGKLVTRSLPDRKFFDMRRFERVEYPLARAVENFLQHGGGVSDAARRVLLALLKTQATVETAD